MPTHRVNFGAAIAAMIFSTACNGASSTPRTADAAPSKAAPSTSAQTPAADPNDPTVAAADRGRVNGDTAAKTWVIIASDFQCPYCKQWHGETYAPFVTEYVRSGKVKVAYINYPLGQHQNAVITAEAALCASAQKKFWEYHDGLFNSQEKWAPLAEPRPLLDSIARNVGVDMAEWGRCVDSHRMLPLVRADRDRAQAAGVRSTPSFIIGDSILAGATPLDEMRPALEAAIAKNRTTPAR